VSLPVMFYIHGGGFLNGGSMAYPPDLYVNNDVVLVTINYRLGPFGKNYHMSTYYFTKDACRISIDPR
jgi:carboxylesterase type B